MLATASGCSSCQPQKPSLSVKRAAVATADFDGATIDVEVEVANPNGFPIFADEVNFQADLEKHKAATGALKKRVTVAGNGKAAVTVPVRIRYADVGDALERMAKDRRWDWTVTGDVALAPIKELVVRLPFTTSGSVDAPRLPTIEVKSSRLENLSPKAATLVVEFVVGNDNSFALPAGAFAGTLFVGGVRASAAALTVPAIKKNDSIVVTLRQPIALAPLGRAALEIAVGRSVDVGVDGAFTFSTRSLAFKKTVALVR